MADIVAEKQPEKEVPLQLAAEEPVPAEEVQAEAAGAASSSAVAAEAEEAETADPLHIGNRLAIVSDIHGLTIGRVGYRDDKLLRIIPEEASDRAVEFGLTDGGADFAPANGVQAVEILERTASDYYVDFLGARPGEHLELFKIDGTEAAPSGIVAEVIRTATKDGYRLEDGRLLEFGGIGPALPIAVVRVRTAANVAAAAATGLDTAEAAAAAATEAARQQTMRDLLATAMREEPGMEIIPSAQQTFPDALQREELFRSLTSSLTDKQKTNPRRIRYLEREVELALALKNATLLRSDTGEVQGVAPQELNTFGDALAASVAPIPTLIPVVAAARVLNLDSTDPKHGSSKSSDVAPRELQAVEFGSLQAEEAYLAGSTDTGAFYTYIYDQMTRDLVALTGGSGSGEWQQDQDILRTAGFGTSVQGFLGPLPAGKMDDKTYAPVTVAQLNTDVKDRSMRVIGPMRTYHPKTGLTHLVAPSDPTDLAGHVVLPPKAALKLRPPTRPGDLPMALLYSASLQADNLPTITETLRALHVADPSPQNAWTMDAGDAGAKTVADWLQGVLQYAVHPAESLGPRTSELLALLDSLGVGGRDSSVAVAAVVRQWVTRSQAQWRSLLKTRREAIQKILDDEPDRVYQSVTGTDSPLWAGLLAAEPLKEIVTDIQRRNPAIAEAPTMLSAALTQEAQGDAAPLVWSTIAKMDSREFGLDEKVSADALAASRAYTLRRKALRDVALLRLRAEPEINTCQHVKPLEAIRNLPDVLQRSRLLREFRDEYQGAKSGDWMTCKYCQKDAICYHELMELEALAQPTRMDAIQKQMLIRYGGGRVDGKIICKNCGQKLQELDYDEHVEFDDEGRPVTEASVLTEEQMEDPEETSWRKATTALLDSGVEFKTTSQREIAQALRTLAEKVGVILTPEVTERIVTYTDIYVMNRAPPQEKYEKLREASRISATESLKKTGRVGKTPYPPYSVFLDSLRVSALIALLAIEMEISDPPLIVNNPEAKCKFARGGWPINPDAAPDAPGCFNYVVCAAAFLEREPPWSNQVWSGEPKHESRVPLVRKNAWGAAQIIAGVAPPETAAGGAASTQKKATAPVLLSFTGSLLTAITRARTDTEAQKKRVMVSRTDKLPVGFRPEPFPVAAARPGLERDPLPAVQTAVTTGAVTPDMLAAVSAAVRTQAAAIVTELHEAARAAIEVLPQKPENRTDYVCCATPLRNVETGALLGAAESVPLVGAYSLLRGAVPTAVNAGTHLWQTFEPAISPPVEQSVEEGALFKLFLKYCYVGPQVGEAHEFSVGNICRQCGLVLGKAPDMIDFGKEGSAILGAQQGALKVETTAGAFESLSDAVRRRRILPATVTAAPPTWMDGLQHLIGTAMESESAAVKRVGAALQTVVTAMTDERAVAEALSDSLARAAFWEPLTMVFDELKMEVTLRLGGGDGAKSTMAAARAQEADNAIDIFDTLTVDPFLEGPRALQEYWCAKTQAAGANFRIEKAPVLRWFKKAAKSSHVDRINKIVATNSNWYGKEASLTDAARAVIARIGRTLGPLLATWVESVRPATAAASLWDMGDAQRLLRSLVLAIWKESMEAVSWMYDAGQSATTRETTARLVTDWTRALMFHVKQQFVRYSETQIRQTLQQRAELERTAVVNEILGQADDDLRAAEFLKKTFRIGRWALGQNLRAYSADLLDAEVEQRRAQGIVEATIDPVLLESQMLAETMAATVEDGYDVGQEAAGDDY